jgi:hypothetical protein
MPNINLYQSALQYPERCFTDQELKEATVVKAGWMPYTRAGQFAVVFKLDTKNGTKAVRCFYHPSTEYEDRYRLFHDHIHSQPLGYLTEFEYLPQGIILGGEAYPIVKMEWVEGETLDRRVESLMAKPDIYALEELSKVWSATVLGLQQASIAHGDMQHGNILSKNGSLCLVDYDGVFIPSFQGKDALEIGHRNYKHPGRSKSKSFGLHIDHFSSFVIYMSIRALAADPKLWSTFHQDDHLILKEDDYVAPHKSAVLKTLKRSKDTKIRELADKLEDLCRRQVDAVPPFASLVDVPVTEPTGSGKAWWSELPGTSPAPTQPTIAQVGSGPAVPPLPKKRRINKGLVLLFLFLALAACSVLCLVSGMSY